MKTEKLITGKNDHSVSPFICSTSHPKIFPCGQFTIYKAKNAFNNFIDKVDLFTSLLDERKL